MQEVPPTNTPEQDSFDEGSAQLNLSEKEMDRLKRRIREDFSNALNDHRTRMQRFLRYYRMWRTRTDPYATKPDQSNFHVPLVKWQVLTKLAKIVDSLFGEDSEIVAVPTTPVDAKVTKKAGVYMSWRIFDSMKIKIQFILFAFFKIVFGRAFAYSPYCRKTYHHPKKGQVVSYDGPEFKTIWPDDIIIPAEDCQSVQEFSFVIRRYRETPDGLLDGEADGRYFGIKENFEKICQASRNPDLRNYETDELTRMRDAYEGVSKDYGSSAGESIEIWEWYGRRRLPKNRRDVVDDNIKQRNIRETELLVRYIPTCELIISTQDLAVLYPDTPNRRPIVEAALIEDGSYWSPGIPELLEDIELEMSATHNLVTEAGEMSVGPLVFYRPGAGFNPATFRYQPRTAIPVDDPQKDFQIVSLKADLSYPMTRQQELLAYNERITGLTDQNSGRAIDRPNAPRTATGQIALLEEGSIRVSLDSQVFREALRVILKHIWNLDAMYAAPRIFFRVTKEKAGGLFDVKDGFAEMTADERTHQFDFDLKFASSMHSREVRKQQIATLMQAAIQMPVIAQDPVAQWKLLDRLFREYNIGSLAEFAPMPGPVNLPLDPEQEWIYALQGEPLHVHDMDDDQAHIDAHRQKLAEESVKPPGERDLPAEQAMISHILEHAEAMQRKAIQQAQIQQAAEGFGALAGIGAQTGGLDLGAILQQGAESGGQGQGLPMLEQLRDAA